MIYFKNLKNKNDLFKKKTSYNKQMTLSDGVMDSIEYLFNDASGRYNDYSFHYKKQLLDLYARHIMLFWDIIGRDCGLTNLSPAHSEIFQVRYDYALSIAEEFWQKSCNERCDDNE